MAIGRVEDLHRNVEYRRDMSRVVLLAAGGTLCALLLLASGLLDNGGQFAGYVILAIGLLGLGWAGLRAVVPGRPMLRLTSAGIEWDRGSGLVNIPWGEVKGVETVTFQARVGAGRRAHTRRFSDCTIVLVSSAFHDRRVDPGSTFKRGPDWSVFVRPHGDHMAIVLHHEIFGTTPAQVRVPVEARWRAFRDSETPREVRDDRFGRGPIRHGGVKLPWR